MKHKPIYILLFAALLLSACSSQAEQVPTAPAAPAETGALGQNPPSINVEAAATPRTITVTGVSQVAVTPDIAETTAVTA